MQSWLSMICRRKFKGLCSAASVMDITAACAAGFFRLRSTTCVRFPSCCGSGNCNRVHASCRPMWSTS